MAQSAKQGALWERPDMRAAVFGIVFSFVFTGLIWLAGARLDAIELLPDEGSCWYYWKLPAPTLWTRATAWGGYLAHQLTLWWVIWYAQKMKPKYTTGLHKFNTWALAVNAIFIGLHLIQTHVFYDGLAQDVSIWSSQGSVIVLLVWVLLMENNRRGVFFGKKLPIRRQIIRFAREYHGYFFAWATVYTFWYHPAVSTSGHLIGFMYMFLMLLQGSLFFTRIHVNRYWTFFQEFMVLFHGTLVAVMQGNSMWPMFFFGFGGIFVITQMWGLNLGKRLRWAILILYILGAVAFMISGQLQVWQLFSIPLIDYVLVVVLALLFGLILWVMGRFRQPPQALQMSGDEA